MSYTKAHKFDEDVVDRIIAYMRHNDYPLKQVAEEAGFTYNQLYQMLKKNQLIKLSEYVRICNALGVPLDRFIDGLDATI